MKDAAPVLRLRQNTSAPARIVTVLMPNLKHEPQDTKVTQLDINASDGRQLEQLSTIALSIETEAFTDYFMVRDAGTHREEVLTFGDCQSDASLLFLRYCKERNELTDISMSGGQYFNWMGESIDALSRRLPSLSVELL